MKKIHDRDSALHRIIQIIEKWKQRKYFRDQTLKTRMSPSPRYRPEQSHGGELQLENLIIISSRKQPKRVWRWSNPKWQHTNSIQHISTKFIQTIQSRSRGSRPYKEELRRERERESTWPLTLRLMWPAWSAGFLSTSWSVTPDIFRFSARSASCPSDRRWASDTASPQLLNRLKGHENWVNRPIPTRERQRRVEEGDVVSW